MKLKCKIKVNLNPFLRLGQELTEEFYGGEMIVEADTHEELIQLIAQKVASIKAPVDAYFKVAMSEETQSQTFTQEKFRKKVKEVASAQYSSDKDDLIDLLKNQPGDKISLVISSFLNSYSPLAGSNDPKVINNRVEYLLKRYDSFSKKNPQNQAYYDEALKALYFTINKQFNKADDPAIKTSLRNQLIEIKKRLGDNNLISVFPNYVQTLYNTIDDENNTYFLEKSDDFFQAELTNAIIDSLKRSLEKGESIPGNEIGIAERLDDGGYKLFKLKYNGEEWSKTEVIPPKENDEEAPEEGFNERRLYIPKTRMHGSRDRYLQEINPGDMDRILRPIHNYFNTEIEDENLEDINIEVSKNVSVVGNLMTIAGIQKEFNELNSGLSGSVYSFSEYPVFTANRENIFKQPQTAFTQDAFGNWEKTTIEPDSFITKGLNLKGDAIVKLKDKYIGEFDTLNYYRVFKDRVEPIDIDDMKEDFFSKNFTASKFLLESLNSKMGLKFLNYHNEEFVPLYVLKDIDPVIYETILNNYLKKVQIVKSIMSALEDGDSIEKGDFFGIDEFYIKTGVNPDSPTSLENLSDKFNYKNGKLFSYRTKNGVEYYHIVDGKVSKLKEKLELAVKSKNYVPSRLGLSAVVLDNNSYTEIRINSNEINLKEWKPEVVFQNEETVEIDELADEALVEKDPIKLLNNHAKIALKFEFDSGLQSTGEETTDSIFVPLTYFKGETEFLSGYFSNIKSLGSLESNIFKMFPYMLKIAIPLNKINNFTQNDLLKGLLDKSSIDFVKYIKYLADNRRSLLNSKLDNISDVQFKSLIEKIIALTDNQVAISEVKSFLSNHIKTLTLKDVKAFENISEQDIETGNFITKGVVKVNMENPVQKFLSYKGELSEQNIDKAIDNISDELTDNPFDEFFQIEGETFFQNDLPRDDQYVQDVLGDISIRSVEENLHLFSGIDRTVLGAAVKDIIYLSDDAKQSTLYHEVFHIAFNNLLFPNEQNISILEAKKRFTYSPEEVLEYAKSINLKGNYEQLEYRFLNEKLADGFAQWKLDRKNNKWREYLGDWIIDIFEYLYDLFTSNKLNNIYKLIDSGKLKNRVSQTTSEDVYYSVYNSKNKRLDSSFFEQIAKVLLFTINERNYPFPKDNRNERLASLEKALNYFATVYEMDKSKNRPNYIDAIPEWFGGKTKNTSYEFGEFNGKTVSDENKLILLNKIDSLNKLITSEFRRNVDDLQTDDKFVEDPDELEIDGEEVSGREVGQSPYTVNPSNLDPNLESLLNLVSISLPRSAVGLEPLHPSHEGTVIISLKPTQLMGKIQRDFSGTILDTETYQEKLEAFKQLLAKYSQVDFEYKILHDVLSSKLGLYDEEVKNKSLVQALITKAFLTQTEFLKIVQKEKKEGNRIDKLEAVSSFEDSKDFKRILDRTQEQLVSEKSTNIKIKNKLFLNKYFYTRVRGVWYKHTGSVMSDIMSNNVTIVNSLDLLQEYKHYFSDSNGKILPEKFNSYSENLIKAISTISDLVKKSQLIEVYFNLFDLNITPAFCMVMAKDANTVQILTSLNEVKTTNEWKASTLRDLKRILRYGSRNYITSVKTVNGKTVWAFTTSTITKRFQVPKEELRNSNNFIPKSRVFIADGFEKPFDQMDNRQRVLFYIAAWRQGLVNLGQLEGNATNFSVKAVNEKGEEFTPEMIEKELSQNLDYFKNGHFRILRDVLTQISNNAKYLAKRQKEVNELYSKDNDYIPPVEGIEGVDKIIWVKTENGYEIDPKTYYSRKKDFVQMNRGYSLFFSMFPEIVYNGTTYNMGKMTPQLADKFIEDMHNFEFSKLNNLDKIWNNIISEAKEKAEYLSYQIMDSSLLNDILIFNLSYASKKHLALKQVYGTTYWQSFKNDKADMVKRAKALGIFGEEIREHKLAIFEDDNEYLLRIEQPFEATSKDGITRTFNPHDEFDYKTYSKEQLEELGINPNHEYITKKDATDGQSKASLLHRLDTIEDKGRLSDEAIAYYSYLLSNQNFVYRKRNGIWALEEPDDAYILQLKEKASQHGFINGVYKTAGGTPVDSNFYYIKQSEFAPPINMYAIQTDKSKKLYKDLLESLFIPGKTLSRIERSDVQKQIYKEIYDTLTPIKGQELLFERMKTIDLNQIDHFVFVSGSKTTNKISTLDNLQIITVPKGGKKHQTEITNWHDHITSSSQQEWYVLQDQNPDTKIENKTIGEYLNQYARVLAERVEHQYNLSFGTLLEDGQIDKDLLQFLLEDFVETKRGKESIKEFFNINGELRMDLPITADISVNFIQNLLKKTLASSVKGEGFLLLSSSFYKVSEKDGLYIPLDFRTNEPTRSLQTFVEVFNGTNWIKRSLTKDEINDPNLQVRQVDEMVVPASEDWHFDYIARKKKMLELGWEHSRIQKELDIFFPQELFYTLGTRIPCENKRSMSICKIIDFIDPSLGSVCIVPTAQMDRTGHDFDGDKLWVHLPHVEFNEDEEIYELKNSFDAIEEFKESPAIKKFIRFQLLKDTNFLDLEENIAKLKSQVNQLRNTKDEFGFAVWELLKQNKKDPSLTVKEYKEKAKELKEAKEEFKDMQERALSKYFKRYIGNNKSRASIENELLKSQMALTSNKEILLGKFGLQRESTDLSDFEEATSKLKQYINTMDDKYLTPYSDINSNNIANQNAKAIGISASLVKFRVLLESLDIKVPHHGMNFNSFKAPSNLTEYEKYHNDIIELGKKYGINFNPIFRNQSQASSILVSANTDAPKGGFIDGINLTDNTAVFYQMATMLGYPVGHAILVANHPAVRYFTSTTKDAGELKFMINQFLLDYQKTLKKFSVQDLYVKPNIDNKFVFDSKYPNPEDISVLKHFYDLTDAYSKLAELSPASSINKGDLSIQKILMITEFLTVMGQESKTSILENVHTPMFKKNVSKLLDSFPYISKPFDIVNRVQQTWFDLLPLSNQYIGDIVNDNAISLSEKQIRFLSSVMFTQQMFEKGIQNDNFKKYKSLSKLNQLLMVMTNSSNIGNEYHLFNIINFDKGLNINLPTTENGVELITAEIYNLTKSDWKFYEYTLNGIKNIGWFSTEPENSKVLFSGKDYVDLLIYIDSLQNGFMKSLPIPKELIDEIFINYELNEAKNNKPKSIYSLLASNPFDFSPFFIDVKPKKIDGSDLHQLEVPNYKFSRLNPNTDIERVPLFVRNENKVFKLVTQNEHSVLYMEVGESWWNTFSLEKPTVLQKGSLIQNILKVPSSKQKLKGNYLLNDTKINIVNKLGTDNSFDYYEIHTDTLSIDSVNEELPWFTNNATAKLHEGELSSGIKTAAPKDVIESIKKDEEPKEIRTYNPEDTWYNTTRGEQEKIWKELGYPEGIDDATLENNYKTFYDSLTELPSIEEKSTEKLNVSEITNHSGGAIGADMMWDTIGKEYGMLNNKHYWANNKTPGGNVELTKSQLEEGVSHAKKAAEILGRPWNDKYANLLGRNWYQVKNSTQIVAIASLIHPSEKNTKGFSSKAKRTTVDGGTGYAVEMGIANNKEVNVFDTKTNQWFKWNGNDFVKSEIPILHKNFAGIGSRQDNGKMSPASIQAIRDVYEKTLSFQTKENLSTIEVTPLAIKPSNLTPEDIYNQLGNKTESDNVVLKPLYQNQGVTYAESIKGIFSLRLNDIEKHFGNPFSSDVNQVAKHDLIQTKSTKESVLKYIDWVLNSNDERAIWIRNLLKSGILKNKPIVYYKELGEPSHATALDYLINKYNWNNTLSSKVEGINIRTDKNNPNSLANKLTNPNWYARNLFDVESVYKANSSKIKAKELNKDEALKYDMNLMYRLQVQKFRQNPELIDEINSKGGLAFILASSHIVGTKNSRWEGKGLESNFIKVLSKSYSFVAKELGKFIVGPSDTLPNLEEGSSEITC